MTGRHAVIVLLHHVWGYNASRELSIAIGPLFIEVVLDHVTVPYSYTYVLQNFNRPSHET